MSKTPKCLNCGSEINFKNEFCPKCGEEIKVFRCIDCGYINLEEINFCPKCTKNNIEKVKAKKAINESQEEYMDMFNKLF